MNSRNLFLPNFAAEQERKYWCWAAVSSLIDTVLREKEHYSQCDIARKCLPGLCAQGCLDSDCNREHFLDHALHTIGRFRNTVPGPLSIPDVINEIRCGRPVGVRIEWKKTQKEDKPRGHFVAIVGYFYAEDELFYRVYNSVKPADYESVPEADLRLKYRDIGIWTNSYYCHN